VAVSQIPGSNPNTAVFRDYSPGPHSGVDTDPDGQVAPGSIDSRARNALTLGLLSLVLGVVTGIPAIWVGRKALQHLEAADGSLRGRWAAWTGILLGCLGVALTIGAWLYLHQRS
jgi:protein-S-isoprenylcysteine O-methyltransferase Ste14